MIKVELEVNLNALYTECDDQSSWYYMRSLFYIAMELCEKGILTKEDVEELRVNRLEELNELIEIAPDCLYGSKFIQELKEL